MIVLDRDVVVTLAAADREIIRQLEAYSQEEWTIPSLVAWESYKVQSSRSEMQQVQQTLESTFDRILDFSDETAFEAAYLDAKLQQQGVTLDAVDLLNLATAHAEGGKFVTHNKRDFDKKPVHDLVDLAVLHTD